MARNLEGLLGNPMFMAGLGLIGSNSWGGAAQGLLAAGQQRQAMAQGEREQQLYDLKMQEYQAKQQEMAAAQQSRAQLAQMYPELAPLINAGVDVSSFLKPQQPQQPKRYTVGGNLVDESGKVLFSAPNDPAAGAASYFTPQVTEQGIASFNNRTGQLELVKGPDGKPIMAAAYSPEVKRDLAGASVTGEAQAQAQIDAPTIVATAEQTLQNLNDLADHPGKATAVGASSTLDPRNYLRGTDAADFTRRLEQVQGQAFLTAFNQLKGGGAITEREGQAATAAITRLSQSQSEREFDLALNELKAIVQNARTKALARARGAPASVGAEAKPGVIDFGSLR